MAVGTLCTVFPHLLFGCPCGGKAWGNRSFERVCKASTEWLPHSHQQVVTSPLSLRAGAPQPDTGLWPVRNRATQQGVGGRESIGAVCPMGLCFQCRPSSQEACSSVSPHCPLSALREHPHDPPASTAGVLITPRWRQAGLNGCHFSSTRQNSVFPSTARRLASDLPAISFQG